MAALKLLTQIRNQESKGREHQSMLIRQTRRRPRICSGLENSPLADDFAGGSRAILIYNILRCCRSHCILSDHKQPKNVKSMYFGRVCARNLSFPPRPTEGSVICQNHGICSLPPFMHLCRTWRLSHPKGVTRRITFVRNPRAPNVGILRAY